MNKQQGFTLIELIMVIVILGILAATALPKFVDLSTDAKNAAAEGAKGAIRAAATVCLAETHAICSGATIQGYVVASGLTVTASGCDFTITQDGEDIGTVTVESSLCS